MKTREELQAERERLQARLVELERAEAEREQAAAALRESEERFELAVRGSADAKARHPRRSATVAAGSGRLPP